MDPAAWHLKIRGSLHFLLSKMNLYVQFMHLTFCVILRYNKLTFCWCESGLSHFSYSDKSFLYDLHVGNRVWYSWSRNILNKTSQLMYLKLLLILSQVHQGWWKADFSSFSISLPSWKSSKIQFQLVSTLCQWDAKAVNLRHVGFPKGTLGESTTQIVHVCSVEAIHEIMAVLNLGFIWPKGDSGKSDSFYTLAMRLRPL